ncbi:MAG: chromosome segregation protein SMC [Clostridia bacterium]|nr:chromosome segregation protein SMC [Clostridia bacterium]
MVLKALELQGFKSFPDKTTLEFDRGMTAVVGPNGSGKSNISDAVRWVLGEQSTKNLRGAKMEDVIFGGTDKRRALGYAEVTLRLDNTDRSLPYDKNEVSVTRRYFRSGESEYRINGEQVRLKDVNELFMDTGLGRDGYSMVSQGKVADMVSAKSSNRRDMLEEAAGISHYRYRRTDAIRRLDRAEENLIRLRDILAELESRVGPLKTQSEKAQKFLVLAEEKKTLEISLWLYTIDSLKNRLQEQEHKIEVSQGQYHDAEEALSKIEADTEAATEAVRTITLQIEEIRLAAAGNEEQIADFNAKVAVAENTIELNRQSIERLAQDKASQDAEQDETRALIEEANTAIAALQAKIDEKQKEMQAIAARSEEFRSAIGAQENAQDSHAQELSELAAKLSDARIRKSAAETAIEEVKDRSARAEESAGERRTLHLQLSAEAEAAQKYLDECDEKVTSLQNSISGYELRQQKRDEKLAQQQEAFELLRRESEQKTDRARMLENLEKNMEGYAGAVRAVMQESRRGTLRGIHGPLSQLLKVPDKYSVAVETALGAAVQFLVVDNENNAKQAITFLKNAKAGRATFLPLTAIRGRRLEEDGLEDCPGYIDIAAHLVKADRKYTDIISAQLGRTVVVDDMDSAVAIGRKYKNRFKIVTLDGQVINAGGSMTGGSRVKNAGLMARSGTIEALKKEAEALAEKLADAEAKVDKAKAEAAGAGADLEAVQADLINANEEKVRAESALELAKSQLETVSTALEELEAEQKSATEHIAELETERDAAAKEEAELDAQVNAVEQKANDATGRLEEIRQSYDEASSATVELNLAILALTKDMEAHKDAVARYEEAVAGAADRNRALDEEIGRFEAENNGLQEQIAAWNESIAALRQKGDTSKEQIDELAKQREEQEAESGKLRLLERNKTTEREQISGELARLEERKANMLRDYDETVNKLFDEYELTRREAAEVASPTEDPTGTRGALTEVRQKIKALGSVNVGAIEEYKEVSERYEFLSEQIGDVERSRKELLDLIQELTGNMAKQFTVQFNRINKAFASTFAELFGGGKAALVLEDESDILECNINIEVQPPGKNVQNIDLLSGGEKGLSAIALLFAILKVTPAPFCIFDEVEAALDDVNVGKFAQYVRNMTENTQFILITHRRGTMEEADIMYGVTMQEEGVSKLLSLRTAEMAKELGLD